MRTFIALCLLTCFTACSKDDPGPSVPAAASQQQAETTQTSEPPEVAAGQAEQSPGTESPEEIAEAMTETAGLPDDELTEETLQLADVEAETDSAPERFEQGRHYELLTAAQPTGAAPGEIEVLEIFWYGCPHCYTLEPHLKGWLDDGIPAAARFDRMPATLNRSWQIHARAYYTAEALGILDEVHPALFREINVNRNFLNTPEQLAEFFAQFGISEADFTETFNSFAVQTKLRRSDSLTRRYRISGVPAIVVNGKYITGADMAGSFDGLFDVIDFLVEKEATRQ
ncbi:MAG: thiol:disulfide interchange protein DsbA/DsbL [Gammaproteobacteria bacterium]|nr:MAG: thiol:disulfide interchange protein DsbA/DsbL [Gammaproteobacteria bacterium]